MREGTTAHKKKRLRLTKSTEILAINDDSLLEKDSLRLRGSSLQKSALSTPFTGTVAWPFIVHPSK
jgi:hypothetical protein